MNFSWCKWDGDNGVWKAVEGREVPEVRRLQDELDRVRNALEASQDNLNGVVKERDTLEAEILHLKERMKDALHTMKLAQGRLEIDF